MNVLARRGKGFNDLQCVGQPSLVPQCQNAETQVSENAIVRGWKCVWLAAGKHLTPILSRSTLNLSK